jgi:DNA-binding MarR family transcriptional regulator
MPQATQPSELEDHLGYWLRLVSNAVSQSFARKLEREGVTVAEWVFLRALYGSERVAPSQLADEMGMTRGAISKLADRLLEKGLIERHANPEDGRGQVLAMNSAGRKLLPRLAALADGNDKVFFGALTSGERSQLGQLLKKIAETRQLTEIPVD